MLAELITLDARPEVVFDVQRSADGAESISGARLDEVQSLLEDHRSRRLIQIREVRDRVTDALADDTQLDRTDREELQARLAGIEKVETTPGRMAELAALTALDAELGRLIVRRWKPQTSSEEQLIQHIIDYCTSRIDFAENDIRRLYVALKTKPFVILAGLTGSGKSSIARLFAEAIGASATGGHFRRIAVRPDWIDQSETLGFINPMTQEFEPGWLADVIRSCQSQPERLFFVLLDEMNLAPVEQYLAELLSAMEEARAGFQDVTIPLYTAGAKPRNADAWPPDLVFPRNLAVIGTVNIDETTRPLSDRVIDRANLLQLELAWSRRHHQPVILSDRSALRVDFTDWQSLVETTPSDRHHDLLVEIANELADVGVGVGQRAHVELERFLANADDILDDHTALDAAMLQRIIPKIRGFKRELVPALDRLRDLLHRENCGQSVNVLDAWLDPSVADDTYIDGTAARIRRRLQP